MKYTPIAILDKVENGKRRYSCERDKCHVAYYLYHGNNGIYVLDQNHKGTGSNPVGGLYIRHIPFNGNGINDAGSYYLLEQDWLKILFKKRYSYLLTIPFSFF